MERVTRAAYGLPPTGAVSLPTAAGVAVHYLGTRYASRDHALCDDYVRAVRTSHMNNPREGWTDIAYNEIVCEHGVRFEGRGYGRRSGANGSSRANSQAYAVCALHGTDSGAPSPALLRGLRAAIVDYRRNGAGDGLWAHGDLHATDCPGGALTLWVHAGAPAPDTVPDVPVIPHVETAAPPPKWPGRVLMYGAGRVMTGDDVRTWQAQMAKRGWKLTVDAVYGPKSADTCRAFQREKGLAADGMVGALTWAATWKAEVTR